MQKCENERKLVSHSKQLNAWLDTSYTKVSLLEAKTRHLELYSRDQFLAINGLQGDKLELQEALRKEKKASAAILHKLNITINKSVVDSIEIIRMDTIDNYIWPVYKRELNDPYYNAAIVLGRDTAALNFDLNAKIIYTYTWEREKGLFSLKMPIVKAVLDNPYVQTIGFESVRIKQKPPRLSWSVTAGLGVDQNFNPIVGIVFGPSWKVRDF